MDSKKENQITEPMDAEQNIIEEQHDLEFNRLNPDPPKIIVKRYASLYEKAEEKTKTYSPCECESGKKFKFCCRNSVK